MSRTPQEVNEDLPLLTLRDGLPEVTDTDAGLLACAAAVAAGHGPVGLDAERASGYRYSNRAYLIQLRREGAGTWLIDPIGLSTLEPLQQAMADTEWILHAATQDLPCLNELGLYPSRLFDTELAARLLGHPRVGLAALVEQVLEHGMLKEHSAADWSERPLPKAWLEYAALDVEPLAELRDRLQAELDESGKAEWAAEEFAALTTFTPADKGEGWRRTSGMHQIRGRRELAVVRSLWETRDGIARDRDTTPGRLIPDSAIVALATALPRDKQALFATKGFHGRGAERHAGRWLEAIASALALREDELPSRPPRGDGPPQARLWGDRNPVAARRLALARKAVASLSEERNVPVENLLTPDYLRRALWEPPAEREPAALETAVAAQLRGFGAREWQIGLTAPLLAAAILRADVVAEGDDAENALDDVTATE